MPWPERLFSTWLTECAVRVSNWAVGSSTSSMSGLEQTARASMRRCASPPERSENRRSAAYSRSNSPMASKALGSASLRRMPLASSGNTTWSSAVRSATPYGFWNTHPTRLTPSRVTVPAYGFSQPARIDSNVDLPQPDGPHTAMVEPGSATKSRCSNSRSVPGNRWASPSTTTRI